MGSTRMQGSALSLTLDGIDYWADVTSVRLTNVANGDPVTDWYGTVVYAPRQYLIKGSAIQSLQTSSFWRYAWANSGKAIAFRYAPSGNHDPSPDNPHFVGMVQVGPPPALGGDAGADEYEFDFEWKVTGTPDIDDGTTPES